jgi:hypothetical protein
MNILPPPGPARRRQLGLLALMVVVTGGVFWYQYGRIPAAAPVPTSNAQAGGPEAPRPAGPPPLPEPVALGRLTPEHDPPVAGRNLFRFGVRPVPPPSVSQRPTGIAPPPPPPVPTGPPAIPLKLVGLLEWPGAGGTRATLKDPASGALFQAFEGEIVDGRYRLVKVGVQSVVLAYLDGSGQRTVPLGGG